MKLNTFRTLPPQVGVAFSGGVDSVVLLHVLTLLKRDVTLYTYDHKLETSPQELEIARWYANLYELPLIVGELRDPVPKGESKEAYWSTKRNRWLSSFDIPICTGHHLNDAAEWYLMTSLGCGEGYLLNYSRGNIVRPLLIQSKESIVRYANNHNLKYLDDPTNDDVSFNKRNNVRHTLLPQVLEVFPGYLNTIRRKIIAKEACNL